MSSTPTPVTTPESELQKVWNWIKGRVTIVEADIAKVLGTKAAQDLEAIGKTLLDSWLGPLATTAMVDATSIATGQISISKAASNLVRAAESSGKTLSQAAAVQAVALLQNALPTANDPTVTPAA